MPAVAEGRLTVCAVQARAVEPIHPYLHHRRHCRRPATRAEPAADMAEKLECLLSCQGWAGGHSHDGLGRPDPPPCWEKRRDAVTSGTRELESVGVDSFAWSRSWSRYILAGNRSDPELQDTNRQKIMTGAARLRIVPNRQKKSGSVELKLKCHLLIEF